MALARGWLFRRLLCGMALLLPAAAQFTLPQALSYSFPSELVAAPHGERVAWVFNREGVRNLWVADGPEFAARQITHYSADDGQEIDSLRITPDSKTLVYSRGSELNAAQASANPTSNVKAPEQQVWAVDIAGGQPRLLGAMGVSDEDAEDIELSPDGAFALWAGKKQIWIAPVSSRTPVRLLCAMRGDNDQPKWSPDGTRVAFVSTRGDHGFIAIYDFKRDTLRYLAPSVDFDTMPRWSPDGSQVVFVRTPGTEKKLPLIPLRSTPWALWVADATSGAGHTIWHSGNDANGSIPWLREDASLHVVGSRVVFSSEQDGWNHLYSVPLSGGSATALTPGVGFEVEDVTPGADGQTVLYSSNQVTHDPQDVDRRHLWRVPIAGGTPVPMTQGATMEWTPVETGDGKQILCLGSTATVPAMPYRLTATGREMLAAEVLRGYPSAQLVTPKQVLFTSEDGFQIHGQLFLPRHPAAQAPAVVFIHGGSMRQMMLGFHYMDYYHGSYAENEYLASRGFIVLSVNYRTGVMYGRAFREPANAGWRGASEYRDIVAAGHFLQQLPGVDAKHIGLWGGSYGGFLTAMGLARNSDMFAAGVDMHGVHDWWNQVRADYAANAPDGAEAAKLGWSSSPDSAVATWRSPVLLIQGDDDRNVSFSQMVDLVQRLRAQHVPFEQIVIPDEIHGFLMYRSWLRAYAATADFLERTLMQGQTISRDN